MQPHLLLSVVLCLGGAVAAAENVMRAPARAALPAPAWGLPPVTEVRALLPEPPAPGSLAARADLETVLQVQATRTPEAIAWARLVDDDDVFLHAALIGSWFVPERVPRTAAFFQSLAEELRVFDRAVKAAYRRERPPAVDARVRPCVPVPTSSSYPSGSALQAGVWAELLAEVFPAHRDALRERAGRAGWGRVVGGVHFPTDVVAGRQLVPAFLAVCRASSAFAEAWSAAVAEMRAEAAKGSRP